MSDFKFKRQAERVEKLSQGILDILTTRTEDVIKKLVVDFEQFWDEYKKQTKLTIAFIGQYNAGKSTLIKALTGDATVRISAEICTDEVTEYPWKNVLLVDTPGIYAGKTDHDQKTLDRISKSDLLVFVVPNELFNPQGAAFFKKVADEMQRVGQMVLVINKMSRESGTPEVLLTTILKVIDPYHPSDFYTCFIDADSYLKVRYEQDEEEKEFLIAESNFNDFLGCLQKLIDKNQLSARLATPLHRTVDMLEQASDVLSTGDKTTRDLLEILRRKAVILRASQIRFRNAYHGELNRLEHEVTMLAERVASKVDGYHGEEEINLEIRNSEREIESVSEKALESIQLALKSEVYRLKSKLEELEQSLLGRTLAEELEIRSVDRKQFNDKNASHKSGTPYFLGKGTELLKGVGNFASKASRDMVYNIGKNFGVKFKPWGAVKGAKFIRGLGSVFAIGGVVLDVFITAKQEQDEEDHKQKLRQARAEIRQDFRKAASEMRKEYEVNIEETIGFYDEELRDIEIKRHELSDTEQSKVDIVQQIDNKLQEIKREISLLTK
ncbi:MAG: 50S ribosome-binding GTPase [Cyanobacteriota bacterium]|nr:50S ribosome-binding GTPase [Cyanobacteriota bacterium]